MQPSNLLPKIVRRLSQGGIISLFVLVIFNSCNQETFEKSATATLAFSSDTIAFDTIFTSLGSTTRQLKVYNHYDKSLHISSVTLLGGISSPFRLNVDGVAGVSVGNIDLKPHDSLYVFVQVLLDPNAANAPLLVDDYIQFNTNGNTQNITLEAWGQDVHFVDQEVLQTQTWTNDKPYLIYHWMIVDTGQVLTLQEGTRIYAHRHAQIEIRGSLVSNGTLEKPVVIEGDRLEKDYWDIPGQWQALAFTASSHDNHLRYTTIKNAVTIQVGQVEDPRQVDLSLENCQIMNMTFAGIYAFGARISGVNLVAANAGYVLLGLFKGGTYRFFQSTFYNQGVYFASRTLPSIVMTNYAADTAQVLHYAPVTDTYFGNCIVWGTLADEIGFSSMPEGGDMQYFFDHCLLRLRSSDVKISDPAHYDSIWYLSVPKFRNAELWNFQLDTLSFAKDKGSYNIGQQYPLDYFGKSRIADGKPDLGAFERIEK